RADQLADLHADAFVDVDPAMDVPARDEIAAPLVHHGVHRGARGLGHGAKRIAVEIDHALRKIEAIAESAQRIGAVERFAVDARDQICLSFGTRTWALAM